MATTSHSSSFSDKSQYTSIGIHFARLITKLSAQEKSAELFAVIAELSTAVEQGHVCLQLDDIANKNIVTGQPDPATINIPLKTLQTILAACPMVGKPGDKLPLILQNNRLYLYRYFMCEQHVAQQIRKRATHTISFIPGTTSDTGTVSSLSSTDSTRSAIEALDRFFPLDNQIDWQRIAAISTLMHHVTIITGGPGTGKTTTVVHILYLLSAIFDSTHLKIGIAAPTGKAAARLNASFHTALSNIDTSLPQNTVPKEAMTLHRLLKINTLTSTPAYNADNPLPYDIVVVDEASMIDLSLMAKLILALRPSARLVLLGDKNQLASVAAGSVLGDICAQKTPNTFSPSFLDIIQSFNTAFPTMAPVHETPHAMNDCIVTLTKSYRFDEDSGIHHLAQAVNSGNIDETISLLNNPKHPDITFTVFDQNPSDFQTIEPDVKSWWQDFCDIDDPAALRERFDSLRILCGVRNGPFGTHALNAWIQSAIGFKHDIWFNGRPIMITTNNYDLGLFNGDIGITQMEERNSYRVVFEKREKYKHIFASDQLPPHETAFALTVHKSQGSEYQSVYFILPEADSPVLCRELLYTAITRAKKSIRIFGTYEALVMAITTPTKRVSGLKDLLWKNFG